MISGFTTASAIIIALSQAKDFLGYTVVRSSEIIPLVKSIIAGADQVCLSRSTAFEKLQLSVSHPFIPRSTFCFPINYSLSVSPVSS